ncbi:hypothetical protein QFZ36_003994 [Pseudarthrobacter siccitolerans]|uniref:DUF4333 domain-containing protein n=1 Tax=Pseudarthrobacter siccitolerans TaxID=861266 RepID=A0ABU0PR40_9MICC|nr:hypothetical protein [Pseudarthrobacter siccitolerans]MDQ0676433.1 hypothetical protein [Pseudarthrobacter siccitolerans]
MGNPQEPYQPREPGYAPQQPPVPMQQPTLQGGQADQAPAGDYQDSAASDQAPDGAYQGRAKRYQEAGPFGLPGQQPPAKGRRKLWIILGSIGGVLLLVILGVIILVNVLGSATNQARGLADDFTKLVIAGENAKAYDDYLDPALYQQLSKEAFITGVESLEMNDSCKPSYNDLKVSTENGVKAADVAGVITCDGKEVDLAYRFEGTDELKMTNIKLRPKA